MPGDAKFDTSSPLQQRPNDKKFGDVGLGSIEFCATLPGVQPPGSLELPAWHATACSRE